MIQTLNEIDLHPYLVYFAKQQFGCHCKTINQASSSKKEAGENKWIHPDIVGFKLNRHEFEPQLQTFYRQMNQDTAYLYSFELKREVKLSDLKKYYFQAVSNSSWANEGYLVTAILDTNNRGLMDELDRLVQAFGIGVILLDLKNVERSRILFESKRKTELDFYTINKLIKQKNTDFIEFIEVINSCLETNNKSTEEAVINQRMDAIQDVSELPILSMKQTSLDSKESNADTKQKLRQTNNHISLTQKQSFKNKKAIGLKINDHEIVVKNWRFTIIEIARYCKQWDPLKFQGYCLKISDDSPLLFLENSSKNWENNPNYFKEIEDSIYVNTHGDNDTMVRKLKKICHLFDIPLTEVFIILED